MKASDNHAGAQGDCDDRPVAADRSAGLCLRLLGATLTDRTGPNISSTIVSTLGFFVSKMVGEIKYPVLLLHVPPTSSLTSEFDWARWMNPLILSNDLLIK